MKNHLLKFLIQDYCIDMIVNHVFEPEPQYKTIE